MDPTEVASFLPNFEQGRLDQPDQQQVNLRGTKGVLVEANEADGTKVVDSMRKPIIVNLSQEKANVMIHEARIINFLKTKDEDLSRMLKQMHEAYSPECLVILITSSFDKRQYGKYVQEEKMFRKKDTETKCSNDDRKLRYDLENLSKMDF